MTKREKELENKIKELGEKVVELDDERRELIEELYSLSTEDRKDKIREKLKNFDSNGEKPLFYSKEKIDYHNNPIMIYIPLSFDKETCEGKYNIVYIHMYDDEYYTCIEVKSFDENDKKFMSTKELSWDKYVEYLHILYTPSLTIKELEKELDRIDKEYA